MSAEGLILGQNGNAAAPAADADLIKDTTTQDFRRRRAGRVACTSGAGRFLGALVRPLQAAHARSWRRPSGRQAARCGWSR